MRENGPNYNAAMEPPARAADQGAWGKIIEDERHLVDLSQRITAIELKLLERRISRVEAILDKKESQ